MFAGLVVLRGRSLLVQLRDRHVVARAPAAFLHWVLNHCDGQMSLAELEQMAAAKWPEAAAQSVLRQLLVEGALVDAALWPVLTWQRAMSPWQGRSAPDISKVRSLSARAQRAAFADLSDGLRPRASDLLELIRARRSHRKFLPAPLQRQLLVDVLAASYGAVPHDGRGPTRRTVPAGGGLYALKLSVLVRRPAAGLPVGLYRCVFCRDGGVVLQRISAAIAQFAVAFNDYAAVRSAPAVIVYCADFGVVEEKYGEKALLYCLLEAGHAVQNAMLAAQALGMATVEVGGFSPEGMLKLLAPDRQTVPLTTLAIGSGDPEAQPAGPSIKTRWVHPTGAVRPAFHLAHASGPLATSGWGRDRDPERAYDKAVWECRERMACAQTQVTRVARLSELEDALHPSTLMAFSAAQLRRAGFGFREFEPARRYRWLPVELSTGSRSWCVAEAVLFATALPAAYTRTPLMPATSSGVAAGDSVPDARRRALLELMERDAFMTWWMSGRAPPVWRDHAERARARALLRAGVEVVVLDLTLDLAPVIAVWAQSRDAGYTAFAAAASGDVRLACQHAFDQAEAQVALLESGVRAAPIAPRSAKSPEHHASLYSDRRWFTRADWFARGNERAPRIGVRQRAAWDDLQQMVRALTDKGRTVAFHDYPRADGFADGVVVSRALVPGLIPLTFGYGTEPWGMKSRLVGDGRHMQEIEFRRPATCFPHPFI